MTIDHLVNPPTGVDAASPAERSSGHVVDFSVDTPIAAIASPPGGAARGIIRISGREVASFVNGLFEPVAADAWNAARTAAMHPGTIRFRGDTREVAIPVQALYWPNRRSYTGQPLIELHLPGSPCLIEAVLSEIYRRGVRPARPGEFTLRAFLAGKLDLIQAEAVLGVIDAQDQVELQTALSQLAGGVSGQLAELRGQLLELLADLEAGLDFIEEDIEFVSREDVVARLLGARAVVDALLQQTSDRMQSRVRKQVVLAGLPNAGKSTIFNRLAGLNLALVSPETGTTRDFLTRTINWNGLMFDLVDTAGWEEQTTGISAAAQQQRNEQLRRADLLVWCTAAGVTPADAALDDFLFEQASSGASASVRILTKIDLGPEFITSSRAAADHDKLLPVSAVTGQGLAEFEEHLKQRLSQSHSRNSQWLGMTAARCRDTLESLSASLRHASDAAQQETAGDELIAVDLRQALDDLGVILGVVYTDDILDRVFSKFCIGK
ncbi:tRNA modification GTPase [Schlesneria sp. DSM 10557]|uniref:tRNA modification GTPase n=1 Tax=Schlesneria sp. DSM 10557 TaxID=3044399 RepID=UPI0035A171D7